MDTFRGQGWLFFVDGLDEIINVNVRERLIGQLSGHLDDNSIYRFAFFNRSIPVDQLERFSYKGIGRYEVRPLHIVQYENLTNTLVDAFAATEPPLVITDEDLRDAGVKMIDLD